MTFALPDVFGHASAISRRSRHKGFAALVIARRMPTNFDIPFQRGIVGFRPFQTPMRFHVSVLQTNEEIARIENAISTITNKTTST